MFGKGKMTQGYIFLKLWYPCTMSALVWTRTLYDTPTENVMNAVTCRFGTC